MFGSHRDDFVLTQEAEAIGASGTARPRVRARRGQATDPHSIAERVRGFLFHIYIDSRYI